MIERRELHIRYSRQFGFCVNSNVGPTQFVEQMLKEWMETAGDKVITLALHGSEIQLVPKEKQP